MSMSWKKILMVMYKDMVEGEPLGELYAVRDALLDGGDEFRASVLGWMMANGRRPYRDERVKWHWFSTSNEDWRSEGPSWLPYGITQHMHRMEFGSPWAAVNELGRALVKQGLIEKGGKR